MAIKKLTPTEPQQEIDMSQAQLTDRAPETTPEAPSFLPALLQTSALLDVDKPKESTDLFTGLKIVTPIELQNNPQMVKGEHINKLCASDGTTLTPIPAPYTITVIAARRMAREEVKDATGKVTYARAYAGGPTNQAYEDFAAKSKAKVVKPGESKPGWAHGNTYVVAVISAQGTVIGEIQACGVWCDYWGKPLYQAVCQSGQGVQVLINDHGENTTRNKANTATYYDPKKFHQWKPVELTRDQLEAVAAVFETQAPKFKAWRER